MGRSGGFLTVFGVIATVAGLMVATNNADADRITGGATTGPWYAMAAVGAVLAVIGVALIIGDRRRSA